MLLLETDRTRITEITTNDAPFILELVNTPGWLKYIGDRNIRSILDAENYINNTYVGSLNRFGFTYYLVSLRNNTPIGICGFLKKDYLTYPDFGFAFMTEYQNQGYAYEAGKIILNYGIQEFDFTNIDAITMLDNIPSMKLLIKLGFVEDGPITMPETKERLNLFCLNKY